MYNLLTKILADRLAKVSGELFPPIKQPSLWEGLSLTTLCLLKRWSMAFVGKEHPEDAAST